MQELITKLGIDWKLLAAQVVNFAILVYILQRFVFKPVLKALESRREQIEKNAKQGDEVEQKLKEAEALKEEVLAKARKDSALIVKEAEQSAAKLKETKLAETKAEADKMIALGKAKVEQDRTALREELRKEMGSLVALAVEKTVGDVIDQHAQKKLTEEAIAIIKDAKVKI